MSRKKSKKTLKRVLINLIALRILKKRADRKEAVKAETLASLKGKNGKKAPIRTRLSARMPAPERVLIRMAERKMKKRSKKGFGRKFSGR